MPDGPQIIKGVNYMHSTQFAYWLQGFFEISGEEKLTAAQVRTIKNHINLVKKCWEPRTEGASPDGPDGGEMGFDLPTVDDDFNLNTPSGEVLLRC